MKVQEQVSFQEKLVSGNYSIMGDSDTAALPHWSCPSLPSLAWTTWIPEGLLQAKPPLSPTACLLTSVLGDATLHHVLAQYLLYSACVASGPSYVCLEVRICPLSDHEDPGRKSSLFFSLPQSLHSMGGMFIPIIS